MAESCRKMLQILECDKQKALSEIIYRIKSLELQGSDDEIPLEEWICLLSGISSIIDSERRSYLSKPLPHKERSLHKLGNEYRWIITHVPERAVRAVWPKAIVTLILSALCQPESNSVCLPLSTPLAQVLRDILSVRHYRHHLNGRMWKNLLNACLKLIKSSDYEITLRTTLFSVLSMLVASNRSLNQSYGVIILSILEFINDFRNEVHCTATALDILNYTLLEGSPEILYKKEVRNALIDSFPVLIHVFSSSRINSNPFYNVVNLFRLFVHADVFSIGAECSLDACLHLDQLLNLHEAILDKVDMSFPTDAEKFVRTLINNDVAQKFMLLPRTRLENKYQDITYHLKFSSGIDIHTFLLQLHVQLILRINESYELENNTPGSPKRKKARNYFPVVEQMYELALSDNKLNRNKYTWCIKVLCTLAISMEGLSPMAKAVIASRFNDVYKACITCKVSEKKRISWLMILVGSVLRVCNGETGSSQKLQPPLTFIVEIKNLCEFALSGTLQDDIREVSFFVIDSLLTVIRLQRMQLMLSWLSQEMLELLNSNKQKPSLIALHSYASMFFMMDKDYSESTLDAILDHLVVCAINGDTGIQYSLNKFSTFESLSIINDTIMWLCDSRKSLLSNDFSFRYCLQSVISPFKLFPEELNLIESKLSYLECTYSDLKSGKVLSVIEESNIHASLDQTITLYNSTSCWHEYWNIETIRLVIAKFQNYLCSESSNSYTQSELYPTPETLFITKDIGILSVSLNFLTSLKICNRLCRLKLISSCVDKLVRSIATKLAYNLSSCTREAIASGDSMLNVYYIIVKLEELLSKKIPKIGKQKEVTELEGVTDNPVPLDCISRIFGSLMDVLSHLLNKLDPKNQPKIPKIDFGIDNDSDGNEFPKQVENTGMLLDYLYGRDTLNKLRRNETAVADENRCSLVISSLRIVSSLYATTDVGGRISETHGSMNKLPSVVMNMYQKLFEMSTRSSFFLLDWIYDIAGTLSENHIDELIDFCSRMLSEYKYEEDFVAWIFVIRSLTSVIPSMSVFEPQSKLLNKVARIFMFFNKRLYTNSMNWVVLHELENFIIVCMKAKEQHPLIVCITLLLDNPQWITEILLVLMRHENFLVRTRAYEINVQVTCNPMTSLETRHTTCALIFDVPTLNKLWFTVSAIALMNCMLNSEEYRIKSLVCLLQNYNSYSDVVRKIFSEVAKCLKYSSVSDMLRKEMLGIRCICESWPLENFMYNYAGYSSLEDIYKNKGHIFAYHRLIKQKFELKLSLPCVNLTEEDFYKISINTIPLVLSKHMLNIIRDTILVQTTDNVEESMTLLQKIKGALECDRLVHAQCVDIIPAAITNILYWCCEFGDNITSDSLVSHDILSLLNAEALPKYQAAIQKAIRYKNLFSKDTSLGYDLPQRECMASMYCNDGVFYTFQDATIAIMSLTKVLNEVTSNSVAPGGVSLKAEIIFREGMIYKVLRFVGHKLSDERFATRKRIFLRYGYALLLSLFENELYNSFFLGLVFSHIYPLLSDSNFHYEALVLITQICSDFAKNDPQSLEDYFVYIITKIVRIVLDASFSGQRVIAANTLELIELIFSISSNIDEKIVKLGRMQADAEIKKLRSVTADQGDITTFTEMLSLAHDTTYDNSTLTTIFTKCIERYTPILMSSDKVFGKNYLGKIASKVLHAYSHSDKQKGLLYKKVGRAICCFSLLSQECDEVDIGSLSILEASGSINFYTQTISIVVDNIMSSEIMVSEHLVHIAKNILDSEDGRVEFCKLSRRTASAIDTIRVFDTSVMCLASSNKVYPVFTRPEIWKPPLRSNFTENYLWNEKGADENFEQWIVNLSNSLITTLNMDNFYKTLPRLFEIKPSLIKTFFPHLIYKCLTSYSNMKVTDQSPDSLVRQGENDTIYTFLSWNFGRIIDNFESYDYRVAKMIIDVVEFLIFKSLPKFDTPFDCYRWLNLNYFNLAKAAYLQNLHVSALRFIELSLEDDNCSEENANTPLQLSNSDASYYFTSNISSVDYIGEKMNLLVGIWSHLGELSLSKIRPTDRTQVHGSHASMNIDAISVNNCESTESPINISSYDLTMPLSRDGSETSWNRIISECESRLQISNFSQAPRYQSIEFELNTIVMEALCRLKMYHTLSAYTEGVQKRKVVTDETRMLHTRLQKSARFIDIKFEGLWRSGKYDEKNEGLISNPQFNQLLHESLSVIKQGDIGAFIYLNEVNFHRELDKFINTDSKLSFERTRNLLVLTEYTEMADIIEKRSQTLADSITDKLIIYHNNFITLMDIWGLRLDAISIRHEFSIIELVIEARCALLSALLNEVNIIEFDSDINPVSVRSLLSETIYLLWFRYIKLAQRDGNYDIALHQILKLKTLLKNKTSFAEEKFLLDTDDKLLDVSFENMKILWDKKVMVPSMQRFQAIRNKSLSLLNDYKPRYNSEKITTTVAKLISCLGKWAGESQSEDPKSISYEYFDTAISIINQGNICTKTGPSYYVYEKYAMFAHEQYNILSSRDPTDKMKSYIDYKVHELRECEKLSKSDPCKFSSMMKTQDAYQRLVRKLNLQIDIGNKEIEIYNDKLSMFFQLAIKNYLLSLQVGDSDLDLSVYRLCTLWFSKLHEKDTCKIINTYINKIPSYKFVPIFHQLTARAIYLAHDAYPLKILEKIIYKTAYEHPHHTLYNLIAMRNTYDCGDSKKGKYVVRILNALKMQKKSTFNDIIMGMETLAKKLIELMGVGIPSSILKKIDSFDIDDVSDIRNIKNSPIAIPIHTHTLSKEANYDDIPTLQYFKPKFVVPGGINKPKVIECVGSDGVEHSLLIKGKDDMRQDSALMSIFEIVNRFFEQGTVSKKKLKIRLYKVVPLAQRAGVVEWIGNTVPIGNYLTNAHTTYNPKDYSPKLAYSKMYTVYKKQNSNPEMKLAVFKDVIKNFKPVFRHFFFENYKSAAEWYSCRSAYIRSLAATSIAGYVLGLGDRHAHNILIDKSTGELIHVDFGVAFDQGKLLSVPETVPFRLTRDMVDGLGRTGCEGMFRKSCEETLTILKKSSEIFILILNVFKYDPLYIWKLTPMEQYKRQGFTEEILGEGDIAPIFESSQKDQGFENKEAERAVFNVKIKLSFPLSVECQVNKLIEVARDVNNLCNMYPGW